MRAGFLPDGVQLRYDEPLRCLDDRTVQAWVSRELAEPERDVIRTHLDTCESCRDLVAAVVDSAAPQTAGRYRLLDVVGGGAMGEVYRAHDPELGRDVAVKLVRPGGSEGQLLREAQAMARLAHPNVIRVYDVGTAGDRVFLAMELVRGRTLRAWFADAARSWRAVVDVGRQAGAGLAAAHAADLVHGDFKPDNVLVAEDGRVLVTDFGLARLQAAAPTARSDDALPLDHTRTGAFAGTPAYMAPEQLAEAPGAAAATAASDQFALCVTLYEALYSRRPFAGGDLASLRAALATGELEFPAQRRVPGRVARILRRGLARDPRDRYPSVARLLADLDAALSRRALWIAGGAALVAGAVATTLAIAGDRDGPQCGRGAEQLAGVWDEATRARVERAFRATDLPYAATSLASVTGLLDRYRATWIAAHTETCEATHVRGEQSTALLDLRMQCLRRRRDDAAAVVARLAEGGRETVRDGVAAVTALPPISDCAHVSSLQELAQPPLDSALRERVHAIDGDTARCRALLAGGQWRHAHACAEDAVQRAQSAGHGPTLAAAALVAGQAALRLRAWREAEAALTRALLAAETARDARTRARALIALVSVAGERAAFVDGRKHAEHASAVIAGLGDDRVLAGDLAFASGVLALREGKLDAAAQALERAVELREQLHGPTDARVAEPLVPLAVVEVTRRREDDAKRLVDRALAIQRETLGDAHPGMGKTLHVAAQIQARVGHINDALASQRRAYELLVAGYGEEHHDVAVTVSTTAQIYLIAGRYAEAAPHARRAVELMEKVAGPDHPDMALPLSVLAAVLSRSDNVDEALAAQQRVLAIRMTALGPDHIHTTQAQVNVAMSLRTKRRCEEALPLLHAARDARIKLFGPKHPEVLRVLHTIADCEVDLGRPQNAVAPLEQVLQASEARPRRTADDRVTHAMATYALARALWHDPAARDRARTLARRAYAELVALKDNRADGVATWAKNRRVRLE